MSVVVPFPESRALAARTGGRGRARTQARSATHSAHGGGVISWLQAAQCGCCGRPTLTMHAGTSPLCAQCTPPSVA